MKYLWKLTVNKGYDWEETQEYLFTKREYAQKKAATAGRRGFDIEKVKVVR